MLIQPDSEPGFHCNLWKTTKLSKTNISAHFDAFCRKILSGKLIFNLREKFQIVVNFILNYNLHNIYAKNRPFENVLLFFQILPNRKRVNISISKSFMKNVMSIPTNSSLSTKTLQMPLKTPFTHSLTSMMIQLHLVKNQLPTNQVQTRPARYILSGLY